MGIGTVQNLSSAGMKVNCEGESQAQREGFQGLPGVCVENRTGTKTNIGYGQHLRRRGKYKLNHLKMEKAVSKHNILHFGCFPLK